MTAPIVPGVYVRVRSFESASTIIGLVTRVVDGNEQDVVDGTGVKAYVVDTDEQLLPLPLNCLVVMSDDDPALTDAVRFRLRRTAPIWEDSFVRVRCDIGPDDYRKAPYWLADMDKRMGTIGKVIGGDALLSKVIFVDSDKDHLPRSFHDEWLIALFDREVPDELRTTLNRRATELKPHVSSMSRGLSQMSL